MDSGGSESVSQTNPPDAGLGGLRSQSVSNLFQGFFGVRRGPASMSDITSLEESDKPPKGTSLDTIVSPSNEDSWILSHFAHLRHEKEDESNLRRNVAWAGKLTPKTPQETMSTSSSITDVTIGEHLSVSDLQTKHKGELQTNRVEVSANSEPNTAPAARNMERSDYRKNIWSSFLTHDIPQQGERKQVTKLGQSDELANQAGPSDAAGCRDKVREDEVDRGVLPAGPVTKEKVAESKSVLRDFLWSFNNEKVFLSKKEVNMIASIDH